MNKLKSTGLFIDKKQIHKCRVLIEEKLDDTEARVEHTHEESLNHLKRLGCEVNCKKGNTTAEA
jgi:hypothetical protein